MEIDLSLGLVYNYMYHNFYVFRMHFHQTLFGPSST